MRCNGRHALVAWTSKLSNALNCTSVQERETIMSFTANIQSSLKSANALSKIMGANESELGRRMLSVVISILRGLLMKDVDECAMDEVAEKIKSLQPYAKYNPAKPSVDSKPYAFTTLGIPQRVLAAEVRTSLLQAIEANDGLISDVEQVALSYLDAMLNSTDAISAYSVMIAAFRAFSNKGGTIRSTTEKELSTEDVLRLAAHVNNALNKLGSKLDKEVRTTIMDTLCEALEVSMNDISKVVLRKSKSETDEQQ
jgi:DNA-binding Xre family transcriptional regulator